MFLIVEAGRRTEAFVAKRRVAFTVLASLVIALLAIAFGEITGQSPLAVLFSGQDELTPVVSGSYTLDVLALLLVCKGVAWAISLGSARGGPSFPAIFLGVVGGLLAAHLPGFAETPAIGVLVGVGVVSVLRLPLSAVVIALLITQSGASVAPLVIVGVAVAYIVIQMLDARRPHALQPSTREVSPTSLH